MAERDLLVQTPSCKGYVTIKETDTLQEVRQLILEDFDSDMIGDDKDFCFQVESVRISRKQETRKRVWDCREVDIYPKKRRRISAESLPDDTPKADRTETTSNAEESVHVSPEDSERKTAVAKDIIIHSDDEDAEEQEKIDEEEARPSTEEKAASDADDFCLPAIYDDDSEDSSIIDHSTRIAEASTLDGDESDAAPVHAEEEAPSAAADPPSPTPPRQRDSDPAVPTVVAANEEHQKFDAAIEDSCDTLRKLDTLLTENPLFCSQQRRLDWQAEIKESLQQSAPRTVVGVLGNTGVGKSSLLNALLNEASILPTSGSRGCTAAVVELRHQPAEADAVYTGRVEFIALQEWLDELKILLEECSTLDEKTIYARVPDGDAQPDAAAAWAKVEQVYGYGALRAVHGEPMQRVYASMANNRRVVSLLTAKQGEPYATVLVESGNQEELVGKSSRQAMRRKKGWAANFRSQINSYVYRKGNGNEPQTWPLIRKVVLQGPWSVLSSGACLVDLPGVRDANAARAAVSEQYLQNCNHIWVVAPIKRAVDDGTAKELLGEQFKRRLLMDGQYGNVSFICTQTDDCEASEIMRDHEDVAQEKEGRWEKMTALRDEVMSKEVRLLDLTQKEDTLKDDLKDAQEAEKEAQAEVDDLLKPSDDEDAAYQDREDDDNQGQIESAREVLKEKKKSVKKALKMLDAWLGRNGKLANALRNEIGVSQRLLKAICATVRNEYSKGCLQRDFKTGLVELIRGSDDGDGNTNRHETPIPGDYEMVVFCISANDYLKIEKIKASSDGLPNTFSKSSDTQIPALRSFVHDMTANNRVLFTKNFINAASDMLDRMKLLASDSKHVPGGRLSRRCESSFEMQKRAFCAKMDPIAKHFEDNIRKATTGRLKPSLQRGAAKGKDVALSTVESWGSKNRRNRNERRPDMNGLYWSTYNATVRRNGVYVSGCAGEIDMNQELCDPIEKEFGSDWQKTMDAAVSGFLQKAERDALGACKALYQATLDDFVNSGYDRARIVQISGTAARTGDAHVRMVFASIRNVARDDQRELNRSLLPLVKERMSSTYSATTNVQRGSGRFSRMKGAMCGGSQVAVQTMFDDTTEFMLKQVDDLITKLGNMMKAVKDSFCKQVHGIYSVCWEDQSEKVSTDPVMLEKIRQCKDALLPDLNKLRDKHNDVMKLAGIEVEEPELDMMAVASLDTRLAEQLKAAEDKGMVIDLCDSDEEPDLSAFPPAPKNNVFQRVKDEPGTGRAAASANNKSKLASTKSYPPTVAQPAGSRNQYSIPPMVGNPALPTTLRLYYSMMAQTRQRMPPNANPSTANGRAPSQARTGEGERHVL